jgi:hypothetical protein
MFENMITIPSSIINMIEGGMYDHLISMFPYPRRSGLVGKEKLFKTHLPQTNSRILMPFLGSTPLEKLFLSGYSMMPCIFT